MGKPVETADNYTKEAQQKQHWIGVSTAMTVMDSLVLVFENQSYSSGAFIKLSQNLAVSIAKILLAYWVKQ